MEDSQINKPHHYTVTIKKAVAPTYADLITNYGKGNVSSLWEESKDKLELHESLRDLTPPTGEVTVFLKKFDQVTTSERAIKWADEHNYRLVFPWERETFSKANPDLQRKFWIVDLGSFSLRGGGRRYVPVLSEGDDRRSLVGSWFDDEWDVSYRFLFASK